MATLNDLHRQRWEFVDPTIPYVSETGIATYFRAHPEIGSPIGLETNLDDGSVAQAFTSGIVRWTAADGAALVSE